MGWGPACRDDDRMTIRLFGTSKTWHKKGVGNIKYAELLALRTKYGRFLQERREALDVQTYACRPIRGSSSWSYHSWPRALDIRPWENPMRDDGVFVTDFDKFGLWDAVRFVGAFLAAGFDWGATWDDTDGKSTDEKVRLTRWYLRKNGQVVRSGRVDPMHFELDDDSDVKSQKYWVRQVRRYRARHPRYVREVYRRAGVKGAAELVRKWYAGTA
jgi:hypothetical protein